MTQHGASISTRAHPQVKVRWPVMDHLPDIVATFRDLDTFVWLIALAVGNFYGVWVWGYVHRAEIAMWRARAETAEEERLKLLRAGNRLRELIGESE